MLVRPTVLMDGRNERSVRTRNAVADAFLDLLTQGIPRPTAQQVAAHAGVSERAVYRHFDDLEGLFGMVADRQLQRLAAELSPPLATGSVAQRIAALVAKRARLYETLTPVRRASILQEPFSAAIATRLKRSRDALRAEAAFVFDRELSYLAATVRQEVVDALGAAVSWSVWENLRRHAGLSRARAERAVTRMLVALLGAERARQASVTTVNRRGGRLKSLR